MNDLQNNPNYNQAITFLMGVIKNQEQLSECITEERSQAQAFTEDNRETPEERRENLEERRDRVN